MLLREHTGGARRVKCESSFITYTNVSAAWTDDMILSRVVDVINHYQPDVALLQEVVRHSAVASSSLQADILAEAIGLSHRIWIPNVRPQRRGGTET